MIEDRGDEEVGKDVAHGDDVVTNITSRRYRITVVDIIAGVIFGTVRLVDL